jgi:diaminopimelate decarboxylase
LGDSATAARNSICLSGLAADLWPHTAQLEADGDITIGGLGLSALAARYGTPAYVLDEADVRDRCRAYTDAFPGAEIAYAGKAFFCRAMAEWIAQEGLSLDVCSAGELAVARSVSFPADRIVLHGNAKTPNDLQAAIDYGVGRVVIDSAVEIVRLVALSRRRQRVLIRVTPDVDPHTHPAVATGVEDQKFGFSLASGAAADAVRKVLTHPELELAGLHCHLGSQITRPQAYELAAARVIRLMAAVRNRYGVALPELNLGGGHAVPYVAEDEPFNLSDFADRIRRVVKVGSARRRTSARHAGAARNRMHQGRSAPGRSGAHARTWSGVSPDRATPRTERQKTSAALATSRGSRIPAVIPGERRTDDQEGLTLIRVPSSAPSQIWRMTPAAATSNTCMVSDCSLARTNALVSMIRTPTASASS